ncbi:phosphoribosyltransferase family protein [Mycoplasma sp. ATU-Cv-508]|uniref:phosphoribosyltransferase n=1 Tax=Mycoplasma sp. ATU-Cv-508 TaxID=2048001 RepID=UPI0031F2DB35
MVDPASSQVIYTNRQIVKKCQELALWIDQNYRESSNLVLVGLLKGSIPFLAELIKHIRVDHVMDFMTVSSFAGGMSSTGQVKVVMDLHSDIHGKDVLIIEEIIDSGQTLFKIVELLKTRQPKR